MCFYYSINNKKPDDIVKAGLINKEEVVKISSRIVVNGFDRPIMPVITNQNRNEIEIFQWGLIPSTIGATREANSFAKRYNTLNAKIETILESKIYSKAIISQRCLVLASGFFEWQQVKRKKIPYYISLSTDMMFAFAGIWDCWFDEIGQKHNTYSILTTQANEFMSHIHNTKKRMPIIIPSNQLSNWLSGMHSRKTIIGFVKSIDYPKLKAHTIKPFLNKASTSDCYDSIIQYHPYAEISETYKPNPLKLDL